MLTFTLKLILALQGIDVWDSVGFSYFEEVLAERACTDLELYGYAI